MRRMFVTVMVLMAMTVMVAGSLFAADHEYPIGNPAFDQVWQRQDRAVDERVTTTRSWTWGPSRSSVLLEDFVDATDGSRKRQVQYFDKSRMEINDPNGDTSSQWYVTNGLLPIEMMTGEKQIGLNTFVEEPSAANITAVGNVDLAEPGRYFPTYANLEEIYQNPGADTGTIGAPVTDMIEQDGNNITMVPFNEFSDDPATILRTGDNGHGIAQAFLDFQNTNGQVFEGGQYVTAQVYNPLFVFGKPVTEPYWVKVDVGSRLAQPILFQVFERRVITYDPNEPDPVFKVAMGNVGQHFYLWQYGGSDVTEPTPLPTATPVITPTAEPYPAP